MKRSNQLIVESAVIGSILVMFTVGGSLATIRPPPSFASLANPVTEPQQTDLGPLAEYYNATLTDIGKGLYANASFLLSTFHFVDIPARVNQTALHANADLASVNASVSKATLNFTLAQTEFDKKDYLNATALTDAGCARARLANSSLADFSGQTTSRFLALHVPTSQYSKGLSLVEGEVRGQLASCDRLNGELAANGLFEISSPQTAIETGGTVVLDGSLKLNGAGVGGQEAVFFINGTRFGSLVSDASGNLHGTLTIPFVYKPFAVVRAVLARNATIGLGGGLSNSLNFTILFNQTSIVVADPQAYLPTQSFQASGSLTTTSGVPLPQAPVNVTFFKQSVFTTTDSKGKFVATLTVPANATDGTYNVYATFAPQQGVFGPSFNFTSVRVVHVPLKLSVNAPFSYAGFPSVVTGSATANGTSVAGAMVVLHTPWGSYSAVTDGSGNFRIVVTVSPFDFGSAGQVNVTALPSQPYDANATMLSSMHFFNVLIVVLPGVVVVTAAYEADKLGAFERLRRGRKVEAASPEGFVPYGSLVSGAGSGGTQVPELLMIYLNALALASARFGLTFTRDQTIREILDAVEPKARSERFDEFSRILLTAEDFLYAPEFEKSRIEFARTDLGALERYWS